MKSRKSQPLKTIGFSTQDMAQKSALKSMWVKLKSFAIECKRVLILTKKPTKEEFRTIVKITGLGMILVGLIGFAMQVTLQLFKGG